MMLSTVGYVKAIGYKLLHIFSPKGVASVATESVVGLFNSICSIAIGTILIITFTQWLWGIGAPGIVKPRSVLIYEGRPWWMKSAAALLFVASSFTLLVEGTFWFFFPYAIPATMGMIEAFWLVILTACACVILADRKKGNSLQETQDDVSGKKA